jgi:hypothetical protein
VRRCRLHATYIRKQNKQCKVSKSKTLSVRSETIRTRGKSHAAFASKPDSNGIPPAPPRRGEMIPHVSTNYKYPHTHIEYTHPTRLTTEIPLISQVHPNPAADAPEERRPMRETHLASSRLIQVPTKPPEHHSLGLPDINHHP